MANRERVLLLAVPIVMGGCVRWGIPDDEFADDYGESTAYESTTNTEFTTTTADPDDGSSGDQGTTGTMPAPTRTPQPWPEQWLFGAESRLVVWGKSGVPTVNLELLANTLFYLAGVEQGGGPLTILWIGDCDPRTDAEGCLAGDVQPFFDLVDSLGTIEFTLPPTIEPSDYDVVIADFCGPVDGERVAILLAEGEGVLALGDRSCITASGSSSGKVANETIAHFGARFGNREFDGQQFPVPADDQSGLLEGVTSLEASGVLLQETIEPVVVVVETPDGVLLSRRSGS